MCGRSKACICCIIVGYETFKNFIFHQVDVEGDHNPLLIFRNRQRLGVAERNDEMVA